MLPHCSILHRVASIVIVRWEVHRSYSKPLIVMSPKFLHHHTPCTSQLSEMAFGTNVRRVIVDDGDAPCQPSHVKKVLFCSGKLAYELRQARKSAKTDDVVIVRVEQIAPFPMDRIAQVLNRLVLFVCLSLSMSVSLLFVCLSIGSVINSCISASPLFFCLLQLCVSYSAQYRCS